MDDADLETNSELATRMNRLFDEIGVVYLVNTRLTDLQTMRRFAKLVVENEMRYKGGANPRLLIVKPVQGDGSRPGKIVATATRASLGVEILPEPGRQHTATRRLA